MFGLINFPLRDFKTVDNFRTYIRTLIFKKGNKKITKRIL